MPTTVPLLPLSPSSFAPFGTCITSPLAPSLGLNDHHDLSPSSPPFPPRHPNIQPTPVLANQNTALKSSPISPMVNHYPTTTTNNNTNHPSRPLMSMFSCFPRRLTHQSQSQNQNQNQNLTLPITILERHPYTTQTFSPLGLAPTDTSTCFLVVVAPSLPATSTTSSTAKTKIQSPPDLANVKAFVARGDQAVTYAPGTWHAPMIVLGAKRVDFVVTQFVNGVPEDDCQEVEVKLDDDAVSVDLDPAVLGLSIRSVL